MVYGEGYSGRSSGRHGSKKRIRRHAGWIYLCALCYAERAAYDYRKGSEGICKIKNIEAALLLFTFQESTTLATARNRLVVDGDVAHACAVMRILDIVEVYLLPKIIAKLAVKRYSGWSFRRKYLGRVLVYVRSIFSF